jgi:hypothetical protein
MRNFIQAPKTNNAACLSGTNQEHDPDDRKSKRARYPQRAPAPSFGARRLSLFPQRLTHAKDAVGRLLAAAATQDIATS